MNTDQFMNQSRSFIEWMLGWKAGLQPLSLAAILQNEPDKVGIVSVDVIKGFCTVGPLSSPRVNQIVQPITRLFKNAWAQGVRDLALPQDWHPEDAVEFGQYGIHCVQNTEETEIVDSFKSLPFFDQFAVLKKNSINCGVNQAFLDWLHARPDIKIWIAVGDCTDICTYQLAMYLRIWANENQHGDFRVIVPVDCVDTYDLPVDTASKIGATPHGAELLHLVFLYHMMLNGIEIVSEITSNG